MTEPGIYTVRGPNGAVLQLQVPLPGLSLAAFDAKVASGELTLVEPEKPKAAPRRKAAPRAG